MTAATATHVEGKQKEISSAPGFFSMAKNSINSAVSAINKQGKTASEWSAALDSDRSRTSNPLSASTHSSSEEDFHVVEATDYEEELVTVEANLAEVVPTPFPAPVPAGSTIITGDTSCNPTIKEKEPELTRKQKKTMEKRNRYRKERQLVRQLTARLKENQIQKPTGLGLDIF